MIDSKRSRGRPKGTEIATDRATLSSMADVLIIHQEMTATAAIKQLVPEWTDSIVHRLRGKWKQRSQRLLADAKARYEVRIASASGGQKTKLTNESDKSPLVADSRTRQGAAMLAAMKQMDMHFIELAASTNVNGLQQRAERFACPDFSEISESMNHFAWLAERPAYQALQASFNSPAMEALRAVMESPSLRALRDLGGSPAMLALREAAANAARHSWAVPQYRVG